MHRRNHAAIEAEDVGNGRVMISRAAFELLQLKDRAMDSIKEGITIADCSVRIIAHGCGKDESWLSMLLVFKRKSTD